MQLGKIVWAAGGVCLAAVLLAAPASASSITLTLNPSLVSPGIGDVGSTFTVDVAVGGLDAIPVSPTFPDFNCDLYAPVTHSCQHQIVSAYDLTVSFDPLLVEPEGPKVTFWSKLNSGSPSDPCPPGNPLYCRQIDDTVSGALRFLEVSYLNDLTLDALQDDTILLAKLHFKVLSPGLVTFAFLPGDSNSGPGDIKGLNGERLPAPEPGALALLSLAGIAGTILRRRR